MSFWLCTMAHRVRAIRLATRCYPHTHPQPPLAPACWTRRMGTRASAAVGVSASPGTRSADLRLLISPVGFSLWEVKAGDIVEGEALAWRGAGHRNRTLPPPIQRTNFSCASSRDAEHHIGTAPWEKTAGHSTCI